MGVSVIVAWVIFVSCDCATGSASAPSRQPASVCGGPHIGKRIPQPNPKYLQKICIRVVPNRSTVSAGSADLPAHPHFKESAQCYCTAFYKISKPLRKTGIDRGVNCAAGRLCDLYPGRADKLRRANCRCRPDSPTGNRTGRDRRRAGGGSEIIRYRLGALRAAGTGHRQRAGGASNRAYRATRPSPLGTTRSNDTGEWTLSACVPTSTERQEISVVPMQIDTSLTVDQPSFVPRPQRRPAVPPVATGAPTRTYFAQIASLPSATDATHDTNSLPSASRYTDTQSFFGRRIHPENNIFPGQCLIG